MPVPKQDVPRRALLDSQLLISFLRGKEVAFEVFWSVRQRYVAAAVVGELATGLYRSKNLDKAIEQFTRLCNLLTVLPATTDVAIQFGLLHAQLLQKGTPIPQNDVWIAATARIHRLPIISNDSHFLLIPQIKTVGW